MGEYIPLRPIPIKDRESLVFLEYGQLDVIDSAFVLVDNNGVRTQIPVGGLAAVMLEPGTRVSHAAVRLAAQVGCLLVWVGEAGVRVYSSGQPGGARADRLLFQAKTALNEDSRLLVVREMFRRRFDEDPPERRSVDQLRGIEGVRVRAIYSALAQRFGVQWKRRNYDPDAWDISDVPNKCVSAATSCLYGLVEAAVLAAGYAPAIGFLHRGKPLSFVYDIADLVKFDTVVPAAFATAAAFSKGDLKGPPEREVRHRCREAFRQTKLLHRLVPLCHEILASGGLEEPKDAPEAMPTALPRKKVSGDDGHRN